MTGVSRFGVIFIHAVLFIPNIYANAEHERKLCKRSNFARQTLEECAADKIKGIQQAYFYSTAVSFGAKTCREFWPALNKCMRNAMSKEKCSNPDHVLSVLKKHTYMCAGNQVVPFVQKALVEFDKAGLKVCKRHFRLRCFPPNTDSIPSLDYNQTTAEEEIEHFQRYWIKPKLKCGYQHIKRVLTEKSFDNCVKHMKDIWTFFSLAINNMAIFGFYSEPGNWPKSVEN